MSKTIEIEAIIKVTVTDEQYEELKQIEGEKATKFNSFGIEQKDFDMDIFTVYLNED